MTEQPDPPRDNASPWKRVKRVIGAVVAAPVVAVWVLGWWLLNRGKKED